MKEKLQNTYNKIDDYKSNNLSKTQNHCIKFIHAYDQDPTEESLNKGMLSDLSHHGSPKIGDEVDDLVDKGLVEVKTQNKLALTEKGKQHL